jgi:hypothetical protein
VADLTLPNRWGEEGFNVIRNAIMDYCRPVHPNFDLGYAFQWDTGTPLIKNAEGLSDAEYINASTALAMITDYLNRGMILGKLSNVQSKTGKRKRRPSTTHWALAS